MEALRKLSLGNNPKSRYVATLKAIATGIETDILHQLIKRSGLKTTATAVAAVLLPVTHAENKLPSSHHPGVRGSSTLSRPDSGSTRTTSNNSSNRQAKYLRPGAAEPASMAGVPNCSRYRVSHGAHLFVCHDKALPFHSEERSVGPGQIGGAGRGASGGGFLLNARAASIPHAP